MNRLLLAALMMTGCLPTSTATPTAPAPVLRSYAVPANAARPLASTIRGLMRVDDKTFLGRADEGPNGSLLVMAPESVHDGVKALISSVSATSFPQQPGVRFEYWVIGGAKGSGPRPAELSAISAALDEVEAADGQTHFELIERLSLRSGPDEHASVTGKDTRVGQRINVIDGLLLAELDLERPGQKLSTRVRLKPGVTAVLASAGVPPGHPEVTASVVYFVVRAALDEAR